MSALSVAQSAPTFDLRLGDCLDPVTGLASLADGSVDHVITDPPYSQDLYSRTRTNKGRGIRKNGRPYRTSGSELGPNASQIQLGNLRIGAIDDILDPVAVEIKRISRRWIVIFSDIEIAPRWRTALGDWYVRTGVWVKPDAMPQITGDRPGQGFEAATIAHRPGRKRWNGGGRSAVWIEGTAKGIDRPDHPCPKPIGLMECLVRDFTDAGDLVVDPFSGSATTGVAAVRNGRRFLGWERDSTFHATALRRLSAAREQLSLFGGAA